MLYDIAIIGAGPCGLFAAFEAGMVGLNCVMIESMSDCGGQCIALYPEKPIYDIPGFMKISASELVSRLKTQCDQFDPQYIMNTKITNIVQKDEVWHLYDEAGILISRCHAIIIATGAGEIRPKKLHVHGCDSLNQGCILYSIKDKSVCTGKNIVIAGGGDSAVDWAIELFDIAHKIYFVHRRENFRAHHGNVELLKKIAATNSKFEFVIPYMLHSVQSYKGDITHVTVINLDGNEMKLEADMLLAFFGLETAGAILPNAGLYIQKIHEKYCVLVDNRSMRTNLHNVYCIGDAAHYDGKLKLILTGFAEAAIACHDIRKSIKSRGQFHFQHSTVTGIIPKKYHNGK